MDHVIASSLKLSRRQWMALAVVAAPQTGCGTIFWPERRGQPAGPLDWKVVALDAIGLLFFFIPGVIAFAVDFSNGTIYLPPGQYSSTSGPKSGWMKVQTANQQLAARDIEDAVQLHTGKSIRLKPGSYQVGKLKSAAHLEEMNLDETELALACDANRVQFRAQSD